MKDRLHHKELELYQEDSGKVQKDFKQWNVRFLFFNGISDYNVVKEWVKSETWIYLS